MFLGSIALLLMNLPLIGVFVRLLSIKQTYLIPVFVMLIFVGIYSIHGASFDLFFLVLLGFAAELDDCCQLIRLFQRRYHEVVPPFPFEKSL